MGGGLALGMMSSMTNQRPHRPEPRPAPGWKRGVSEKKDRFLLSGLRADASFFFPEAIFRLVFKQIYFKPALVSAIVQRVSAADAPTEENAS